MLPSLQTHLLAEEIKCVVDERRFLQILIKKNYGLLINHSLIPNVFDWRGLPLSCFQAGRTFSWPG